MPGDKQHLNDLGQPIGFPLPGWGERPRPPRTPIVGRFCSVEALDAERHAAQLFEANGEDRNGRNWTYLPYGPFATLAAYRQWVETASRADDPLFYAILDNATGQAVGVASLMRIDPKLGVIEVGGINYSPNLQRRPAATEAMYLMMRRVFDELGYRRYEWKCDSLNAPSRAAAVRLGFQYEGLFRQATVYKGRNRDTAWFSILDREWPHLRAAFEAWLDPSNFDAEGRQRKSLASFRSAA
jgi:RimJ/RimL family protein N-acetyltransferase